MEKELWRQLIHASGVFIVILSYFLTPQILILLCVAILVFVEVVFRLDHHYHVPLFSAIFRVTKRQNDEKGFIYFFIGIILTLYFFQFNIAIANAAILILLFGDSASTIIGKRFGKTKLPFQPHKTLEGSLAFLIVGFLVSLTQIHIIPAFVGALAGMVTEAYSPVDDNVPIPLVSALLISLVVYSII
ncbi:diacylglycerol/polyprenol kinase family protein [Methanobacterium petrolearium]|uniref:diacylglycerol/polyprenol kinase family protein n=1 Tax=Methanobacterium petrolearium TaxID=710190 RepID=UPI001AE25940|nr:phosphatidate cytidylyltransferase [Methanobacterium petrolearium]MBP1944759.1 dolichol kinase [Methanobacterium petrolearium]BDZ70033.1 phosphatidate cytidylyltransferase [Methanobacterium petrolearium]